MCACVRASEAPASLATTARVACHASCPRKRGACFQIRMHAWPLRAHLLAVAAVGQQVEVVGKGCGLEGHDAVWRHAYSRLAGGWALRRGGQQAFRGEGEATQACRGARMRPVLAQGNEILMASACCLPPE